MSDQLVNYDPYTKQQRLSDNCMSAEKTKAKKIRNVQRHLWQDVALAQKGLREIQPLQNW